MDDPYWYARIDRADGEGGYTLLINGTEDEAAKVLQSYLEMEHERHDFALNTEGPFLMETHPACAACSVRERCHGSRWKSANYWKPQPRDKPSLEGLTHVHTCSACFEKSLSTYWKEEDHKIVHDDCPRWHPRGGSALECDGCRADLEAIRKAHPNYNRISRGTMRMFERVLAKARGEDTDPNPPEFDGFDEDFFLARMPFSFIKEDGLEVDEIAMLFAWWGLRTLLAHVPPGVSEEFAKLDVSWRVSLRYEWLETLYLAFTRHAGEPDAVERITREWFLMFKDKPQVSRGMMLMTRSAKKMQYMTWRRTIEEAFQMAEGGTLPAEGDPTWIML